MTLLVIHRGAHLFESRKSVSLVFYHLQINHRAFAFIVDEQYYKLFL